MSKYKEIDLSSLKRYSVAKRNCKVQSGDFAKAGKVDVHAFIDSLPDILKAKDFKDLISACEKAKIRGKAIIIGLGGHVIKCGLAPLIIELLENSCVSAFSVNGSVLIHDFEIAMYGKTSEDVASALSDGSFGMAIETADIINGIICDAYGRGEGIGEALGAYLLQHAAYPELSLIVNAAKNNIPLCAHIAIGTDIIHQHASANGAAIGECSLRDFRILCEVIKEIDEGGVYLNFGSAVILPEVFLKALTVARNVYGKVENFSTAVFDMNIQYRSVENVMRRPVGNEGKGYYFVGHHEIMIPLLIKALL